MAVAIAMTQRADNRVHPFFKPQAPVEDLTDLNYDRRKRQKTESPPPRLIEPSKVSGDHTWIDQLSAAAGDVSAKLGPSKTNVAGALDSLPAASKQSTAAVAVEVRIDEGGQRTANHDAASTCAEHIPIVTAPDAVRREESPPRKMLRVRSDGKLSSPKGVAPANPRRGRKPRASKAEDMQEKGVVVIKYGKRKKARRAIGAKIDAILSSDPRRSLPQPGMEVASEVGGNARETHPFFTGEAQGQSLQPTHSASGTESRNRGPPKPTHPFFTGEAQRKTTSSEDPSRAGADVQAAKQAQNALQNPKKARVNSKPPGAGKQDDADGLASFPTFGSDHAKLHRFPGAKDPIWPPYGMVHTGLDVGMQSPAQAGHVARQSGRKMKSVPMEIAADEDVFNHLREILARREKEEKLGSMKSSEASRDFRQPTRHILTADALQTKVKARMMRNPTSSPSNIDAEADEFGESFTNRQPLHGAVARLYDRLGTARSAFDKFECEMKTWTQKYAPQCADDVLQEGPEATLLRDWLRSLTVSSVTVQNSSNILQRRLKANKKKRKRKEGLDDFIVSSDDEMTEMTTLDGRETGDGGSASSTKRTMIQQKDSKNMVMGHSTHAAVVSGPHGCGKSATVYAVANELGFEVFEINAGSRRNGRDVLEKVGDMTHNHLVHNDQNEEPSASQIEAEEARHAEKLTEDLASGKQKTMGAFFKAKSNAKKKPSPRTERRQKEVAVADCPARQPKSQKQSLILLEEVDVLFDEDKPFWTTVLELIVSTRRPIIMTCTDERQLPMEEMDLHGIFRFSLPPKHATIDYLLLLASLEGHLLEREALRALYEAKSGDLRGAIMELQFHSQMAVGDQKGGLEWMLIQSPSDVQAEQIPQGSRVISGGTYQSGMGWLDGERPDIECESTLEQKVDMLMIGINEWGLDADDMAIVSAAGRNSSSKGPGANLSGLRTLDQITDALSVADLLPNSHTRLPMHAPLDPTQPDMPDKLRCHFTESPPLIQIDLLEDQTPFGPSLALTLRVLAIQLDQPDHIFNKSPQLAISQAITTCQKSRPNIKPHTHSTKMRCAFSVLSSNKAPGISSLDSPSAIVAREIAPYVRSIASYDLQLAEQRQQLSAAFAEPGRDKGKARKTRASLAALEGGSKASTRKQRWFSNEMDYRLVLETGGKSWLEALQVLQDQRLYDETEEEEDMEVRRGKSGSGDADSMVDELSK